MESHSFYRNRKCEYFPCHQGLDGENFNCLFCFCPLYCLGDRCGGNFVYLDNGIKDCSGCLYPHRKENYEDILKHMAEVMEMAKKP